MKGQLMRFVVLPSGKLIYDHSSRMNRRGTYVCPGSGCIEKLAKAKGRRLISNQVENSNFIRETVDLIAQEINRLIKMCSKMGYCHFGQSQLFSCEDILIFGQNASEHSEDLIRRAEVTGNRFYKDISSPIEISGGLAIVKGSWPLLNKLAWNLELYNRLSPRGVTV